MMSVRFTTRIMPPRNEILTISSLVQWPLSRKDMVASLASLPAVSTSSPHMGNALPEDGRNEDSILLGVDSLFVKGTLKFV